MKTTTAEKLHKAGKLILNRVYEIQFSDFTAIMHYSGIEPFTTKTEKEGREVIKQENLFCFYHPIMNFTHKNFGDHITIII